MPPESQPSATAQKMQKNYCRYEGYLVNGDSPVPIDPVDYDDEGVPVLGCNRLRCPACKALVRSAPHLKYQDSLPKVNLAELYEVKDLATSPLLQPWKGIRFYLCRCQDLSMSHRHDPLGAPDRDPFYDAVMSWRCDGHPIAELPRNIDGVEVTPKNVGDVTTQSLRGILPPGAAAKDREDGAWAARLHARLAKTPWQESVVTAALSCLVDSDFEPRTRALHFFLRRNIPAGAQRAIALLDGDRALFAEVPDLATRAIYKNQTLEHTLWLLATPLVAQPGRARELARKDALTSGKASAPLYEALAAGDADWVAAHVDELVRANPSGVQLLATAIGKLFPERLPTKPVLDRLTGKA